MTKVDIFSGFLGAGKTTLIKKLLQEAYVGEKVVLIENEFGEIGIDGGFLQDAGVNITEMNSGCICCSLVGDFSKALQQVVAQYAPDRILIEPSGVGKLSDVMKAVKAAQLSDTVLNAFCTVVNAGKCKMYMKNFGEFFNDQVENASCIVLSHTSKLSEEKLSASVALLKEKNAEARIVTADWNGLSGKDILSAMKGENSLQTELSALENEVAHHHDHECHDEHCDCHHEHHHHDHECHDEHCDCHQEHHHHDHECHDEHCDCHHDHHHEHHEHHHDHECHHEHCDCHHDHHGHGHHEHHHADEVFISWGKETTKKYVRAELENALAALADEEKYGVVLRAKGIVAGEESWLHFDYVPEEGNVREGAAGVTGRICVIGCQLNEKALEELFNV